MTKLHGVEDAEKDLKRLIQKTEHAAFDVLEDISRVIYSDARKRTPVDTGLLKSSYGITSPKKTGKNTTSVKIENNTPYAIFVHEMVEIPHKIGEAKFLHNAMQANEGRFLRDFKNRTGKVKL